MLWAGGFRGLLVLDLGGPEVFGFSHSFIGEVRFGAGKRTQTEPRIELESVVLLFVIPVSVGLYR